MRLLLDTHIALWAITDDKRLSRDARHLIMNLTDEIYVSSVSLWEIGIKHALRKESMPLSAERALEYFKESGYVPLPIKAEHALVVETLPAYHADPFDRMLVAQALYEPLRLMTRDTILGRYSESLIILV